MSNDPALLGKLKALERRSSSPATPKIIKRAQEALLTKNYTEVFPMLMHLYTVEIDHKETIQEVEDDVHVLFEEKTEQDKDFHLAIDAEPAPIEMVDRFLKKVMDGGNIKKSLKEVLNYYDVEEGSNVQLTYFGTSHGFVYIPV